MSIVIVQKDKPVYCLSACDIQDGRAYESDEGLIFIGNSYENVRAYSVDGGSVISKQNTSALFREVNLQISVS